MNARQYKTLFTNGGALKVLEYILESAAADPHWYQERGAGVEGAKCTDCGVYVYYVESGTFEDWMRDKDNHKEDCLYRVTEEFLINLDTDGYKFTLPETEGD